MKNLSSIISTLFMILVLSSTASASSENPSSLQPTKNTDIIFENANIIDDGENVTFTMSQKFEENEEVSSEYDIEIDLENLTYTVVESKIAIPQKDPQFQKISALAASGMKYIFVTARTLDPPGEVLNSTQSKLWWRYGNSSSKVATEKRCYANPLTNLRTTWYTRSCLQTHNSSSDGGRTQNFGSKGSFYNYDWLDDKKITETSHNVYVEGYNNGSSGYTSTMTKSGESSSILRLNTIVSKGNM